MGIERFRGFKPGYLPEDDDRGIETLNCYCLHTSTRVENQEVLSINKLGYDSIVYNALFKQETVDLNGRLFH